MTKAKLLVLMAIMAMLLALPAMVLAQAPPLPAVFVGSVTLDGMTAADGTTVTATIGGLVGPTTTVSKGSYALRIPQSSGSSYTGKEITFKVGTGIAAQKPTWFADGGGILNLTAVTGPPPATATRVPPAAPVVGPAGPAGPGGAAGASGVPGPAGAKGAKGDTGAKGAAGAVGPAGAAGSDGADGAAGSDGAAGAAGPAGSSGADGAAGEAATVRGGMMNIIALIVAVVALVAAGGGIVMGGRR